MFVLLELFSNSLLEVKLIIFIVGIVVFVVQFAQFRCGLASFQPAGFRGRMIQFFTCAIRYAFYNCAYFMRYFIDLLKLLMIFRVNILAFGGWVVVLFVVVGFSGPRFLQFLFIALLFEGF